MSLSSLALPFLRLMDPEQAHQATLLALKAGLGPCGKKDPEALGIDLLGMHFPNPLGIAAGFDKNGEVPDAMLKLGFGFAEVGTTTPRPQSGNPKPRIFRLQQDRAVINRLGFNNEGHEAMEARLKKRAGRGGIVGVNLGANKDTEDKAADYVTGIKRFESLASYFTVNVSSPNTPGLRGLQSRAELEDLLGRVLEAREGQTPVLLKIAPDLVYEEREDIAAVVLESGVDGLIVSNTTIARDGLVSGRHADETGGLSGAPLMDMATDVLADMRRLTKGTIPLIGVGGVSSGTDAYKKIRAGASLVQLYTALTFRGADLVTKIKRDLASNLKRDGYKRLEDAIGVDVGV
ncbi:MAG: dihydroorotate dehydrogenase (quinone) [Parvibaculum sp.]|nr:dihydroorotate dehydrogenase (quinone) [Parvibaculum sp.]|tara:strand:+ start:1686 stop:2729 length:1044 start_codon:yes stop_codon:yes gene_type:complete